MTSYSGINLTFAVYGMTKPAVRLVEAALAYHWAKSAYDEGHRQKLPEMTRPPGVVSRNRETEAIRRETACAAIMDMIGNRTLTSREIAAELGYAPITAVKACRVLASQGRLQAVKRHNTNHYSRASEGTV